MCWNNAMERRKFEAEQKKQAEQYHKCGMSDEQIHQMYLFDYEQFKSRRRYAMHTQEFTLSDFEDDGVQSGRSPMYERFFDALTTTIDESHMGTGKYAWIEDIENEEMIRTIRSLTQNQLELLSMLVEGEMTQDEIKNKIGISQAAVSQRISTLRKVFAPFSKNF